MRRLAAFALVPVLAACSMTAGPGDATVAVVVTNGSLGAPILRVDTGDRIVELGYEPCTSRSESFSVGTRWELEAGGAVVLRSDRVVPLPGASVTVVEVVIDPDGNVDVHAPRAAEGQPDARLEFPCAGGPRSHQDVTGGWPYVAPGHQGVTDGALRATAGRPGRTFVVLGQRRPTGDHTGVAVCPGRGDCLPA